MPGSLIKAQDKSHGSPGKPQDKSGKTKILEQEHDFAKRTRFYKKCNFSKHNVFVLQKIKSTCLNIPASN